MGSLRISCALWSLSTGPTDEELAQALKDAARIGVRAVQPWCVDVPQWKTVSVLDPDRCTPPRRQEWARRIRDCGLEISGFCAQLAGPRTLGGFGESEGLEERLRKTQAALRLAAEMGAPIVTTHVGPIPEDRESPTYQLFLRSVGACAKAGEECGACFALETGQERAEVLLQFLQDLGSPALKVNYDPANMLKYGPVQGVSILKEYIVHTHAKDKHPQTGKPTVGQGAVPWDEYIAALRGIGYTGWYALEDESGKDAVASLQAGRAFLERY